MTTRNRFDRVSIAPSVRTPIVTPVNCIAAILLNEGTAQAKLWDAETGGVSKNLNASVEFTVRPEASVAHGLARLAGFKAGDTVMWVEAVSGTGPIAANFVL